jgi:cytochrome c553
VRLRPRVFIAILLLVGTGAVWANPSHDDSARNASPRQVQHGQTKSNAPRGDSARGAVVMITNCGRCHTPPQDLTAREAPAVIRQMRVRANLSEQDERDLLAYFAPNRSK